MQAGWTRADDPSMLPAVNRIVPATGSATMLDTIARALLHATALVPIIVIPGFFFPYVSTRAVYFRVLVQLATAILLYLVVRRRVTVGSRRDVVLAALVAWVAANALAAAFGASPVRSFFGDLERMGGVWFWLHLAAYYVLLRTFFGPAQWLHFFRLQVGVAAVVATYGMMHRWWQPLGEFIPGIAQGSTVGNPGLLAPYLLAALALCVILAFAAGRAARVVYLMIALILIAGVVLSGNRSSTLALPIGAGVAIAGFALWSGRLHGWRIVVVAGLLTMAAALPFLAGASWADPLTSRVEVLSKLARGVDATRVIQWRAAIESIRDRPLLGVGPENYHVVWSRYYDPAMHRFVDDLRWDRAHNAYLEAFATAGVLGFLTLLSVVLALAWSAWQAARASPGRPDGASTHRQSAVAAVVSLGLTTAYAFYLFFWFFDLNATMLWIALGAYVAGRATGEPLFAFGAPAGKRWQSSAVLVFGALALAGVLYVHGFETLRMARNLDRARDPRLSHEETLRRYEAVFASPAPVTHHVFVMYAAHLASLRPRFREIRADPASAALFNRAFVLAIEEFERQAVRDPHNERVSVQHARVLMLGAYYYDNMRLYESALRRLERAVELAPRRVPTRLSLGMAYLNVQRPREALAQFATAYDLYPPLGQTQAYLGLAYASLNENPQAVGWLKSAMTANYKLDRAVLSGVATAAARSGHPELGADLLRHYLTRKYGPRSIWPLFPSAEGADYQLAKLAIDLFQRSGDEAAARTLEAAVHGLCERPVSLPDLATTALRQDPGRFPDCLEPWRTKSG